MRRFDGADLFQHLGHRLTGDRVAHVVKGYCLAGIVIVSDFVARGPIDEPAAQRLQQLARGFGGDVAGAGELAEGALLDTLHHGVQQRVFQTRFEQARPDRGRVLAE